MSQIDQIQNFCRLASLCGASEALQVARKVGLMQALDGPPRTVEELSETCQIPADRLTLLLDVLVSTGAIEQYGDDFAISTAMRLANSHPGSLHGPHWENLPAFLLDGERHDEVVADTGEDDAHHRYRGDTLSLQWTLTAAAMELADVLKLGVDRTGLHILDLGAGSAMWSCALAYRDPQAEVTAVDVPEALQAAARTSQEIEIESRVNLLPGDYRTAELPESTYDLVLAVDLLQLQPLEQAAIWLTRARRSLRPGGELVIVGRFPGQPRGDLHRLLGALELALRVPQARQHEVDEIRECLRICGFEPGDVMLLDAPPYSMGMIISTVE